MKILYFDCFSGISGDMTLGALIDLGVDPEILKDELSKLNLKGYELIIERKVKSGISGIDFTVALQMMNEQCHNEHRHCDIETDVRVNGHGHNHDDHGHNHDEHSHSHDEHIHNHDSEHKDSRNLLDIEKLIDDSSLKQKVKDFSKKVFREIASAEAKVHGLGIEEVHFHEVGAVDSIVDIVGVAICLDLLDIRKVFSSPLHDGKGYIQCQHGIIPVPVPAVMEMLSESNIPLITENINTELVTPTGMGIIKCLATDYGNMPAIIIDKIGYGFGKRETGRLNALRIVMGTLFQEDSMMEEIAVLETNIDDMNPELISYTMECLFEKGARDVYFTPIFMKKNRPAVKLTVITDKDKESEMTGIILRETTTLGVRSTVMKRVCMDRKTYKVKTEHGEIRIKVSSLDGVEKDAPEYEDCRVVAKKAGMALRDIYQMAKDLYKSQ